MISFSANTCPADLERLTSLLIQDLPSYANRVTQRRLRIPLKPKRPDQVYSSLITAGKPDFTPIDNLSREYPPIFPDFGAKQVFITTIERQYTGLNSTEIQQFHWLFLVKTRVGWRLDRIYTKISTSSDSQDTPISSPIDSSRSIIGEAIKIWLNDCYTNRQSKNDRISS